MSDNLEIYAEWEESRGSFRLSHESEPQTTIGYAGTIAEAEKFAKRLDCSLKLMNTDSMSISNTMVTDENLFSVDKPRHRLYVDMDGTLAEFKVVTYQEQLFEQGYFANLKPHDNVVSAIKNIIKNDPNIEVYVLSAYLTDSEFALNEKNQWLDRYIPEIDSQHRVFVPCGTDKKKAIEGLSTSDYLLDDYTENLLSWVPPGKAIKLINNINHTHGTWKEDCIRYDRSPDNISELITGVIIGDTRAFDTKNGFDKNHFPFDKKDLIYLDDLTSIQVAKAIDDFYYGFDTYDYNDNIEDREVNIRAIEQFVLADDTYEIKETLNEVVSGEATSSIDSIEDAQTALDMLAAYKISQHRESRPDGAFVKPATEAMGELGFKEIYSPGWSDDGMVVFHNTNTHEEHGFDGYEMALDYAKEQSENNLEESSNYIQRHRSR